MAKDLQTKHLTALLNFVLGSLPTPSMPLDPVPNSPKRRQANLTELREVIDYLGRKLNAFDGKAGNMGSRLKFKQPNEIKIQGRAAPLPFPPLQELIDTYQTLYPSQIHAHLVGREVLDHLLKNPSVVGIKINYGVLPGYEATIRSPLQRLYVKVIYRLQQLLLPESREPRQVILVGVGADGNEIRNLATTHAPQPRTEPPTPAAGQAALHGTPYSLPAGTSQPFSSSVPGIRMAQGIEEAYDTLPTCPPNHR